MKFDLDSFVEDVDSEEESKDLRYNLFRLPKWERETEPALEEASTGVLNE